MQSCSTENVSAPFNKSQVIDLTSKSIIQAKIIMETLQKVWKDRDVFRKAKFETVFLVKGKLEVRSVRNFSWYY